MGKLFTWNVNGIQDNVGIKKARFLKHKIHELRNVEICLVTETHIESKEKISKELFDLESLIMQFIVLENQMILMLD